MKALLLAAIAFSASSGASACNEKERAAFGKFQTYLNAHPSESHEEARYKYAQTAGLTSKQVGQNYMKCLARVQKEVLAVTRPGEDDRTSTKDCYTLGFEYAVVAIRSMRREPTPKELNFAMPGRCKETRDAASGIRAGTAAAMRE